MTTGSNWSTWLQEPQPIFLCSVSALSVLCYRRACVLGLLLQIVSAAQDEFQNPRQGILDPSGTFSESPWQPHLPRLSPLCLPSKTQWLFPSHQSRSSSPLACWWWLSYEGAYLSHVQFGFPLCVDKAGCCGLQAGEAWADWPSSLKARAATWQESDQRKEHREGKGREGTRREDCCREGLVTCLRNVSCVSKQVSESIPNSINSPIIYTDPSPGARSHQTNYKNDQDLIIVCIFF